MTEIHTNYIPLIRLRAEKERLLPCGVNNHIDTPEKVVKMVNRLLKDSDREQLLVLSVDVKSKPVCIEYVAVGALNVLWVEPREVFKHAVLSNASAIIMVHNHPSGDITPSLDDFKITKRIMKAGELMGIHLLDHIIIGDNEEFFNFKDTEDWMQMKSDDNIWDEKCKKAV